MTWTEIIERYLREGRTVSGGKGDHSSQEQSNADQLRQQENNLMQQQLQMQMKQLSGVNAAVDPIIAQGGMSPQQQASETAQMMNNLPAQFQGIQGNINQQLVSRGMTGGGMAGSGDVARNFGSLGAMEAGLQQQGLMGIQQQKYQQLMQAIGAKMGVAGMFGNNVGGFNSGTMGAMNAGVTAANNADQAQTSWLGPMMGALGSLGGAAITGGFGGSKPCWIARAVYGENDPRWVVFRDKFIARSEDSYVTRILLGLYIIFGEPVAELVKRSSLLKKMFKRWFDRVIYA